MRERNSDFIDDSGKRSDNIVDPQAAKVYISNIAKISLYHLPINQFRSTR